jgi:hypothetical protein
MDGAEGGAGSSVLSVLDVRCARGVLGDWIASLEAAPCAKAVRAWSARAETVMYPTRNAKLAPAIAATASTSGRLYAGRLAIFSDYFTSSLSGAAPSKSSMTSL